MSLSFGYEATKYESSAKASFKGTAPDVRTQRATPDMRSAHFSFGDEAPSWSSAASSYGAHGPVERTVPVKPSGGSNLSFGTAPTEYKSAAASAYGGSLESRPSPVAAKDRSASRSIVLGDDVPVYESEAMHQSSKGTGVAGGPTRAPERKRGTSAASFVLGTTAVEYTTTTSSSMVHHGPEAAAEARTTRAPKPTQPAIVLGDDSIDFVTTRMAEEGLITKTLGQRYKPQGTTAPGPAPAPTATRVPIDRSASWTLGSDEWNPTSTASEFKWPTGGGGAGVAQPPPRTTAIHFGDEPSRFVSEASGTYAAPVGGGRQASSKPTGGTGISFGSDPTVYTTAYGSTMGAPKPSYDGPPSAASERTALKQSMQQRSIQFGDDASVWESSAQAGAKGFLAADGTASVTVPERKRGQAGASFVLGNDAPEYVTTTSAVGSGGAAGGVKVTPRAAGPARTAGPSIVFGDDKTEYVTARMAEDGSTTKTLKQRYVPHTAK